MKGAIWKIETSAAITTKVDTKSVFMPIKVTIPWAEVDDAEGCSIVAVPSDPAFALDEIYLTTITIDPATGHLIWTTPDNYDGTVLSLDGNNLIATVSGSIYPATLEISDGYLLANI